MIKPGDVLIMPDGEGALIYPNDMLASVPRDGDERLTSSTKIFIIASMEFVRRDPRGLRPGFGSNVYYVLALDTMKLGWTYDHYLNFDGVVTL